MVDTYMGHVVMVYALIYHLIAGELGASLTAIAEVLEVDRSFVRAGARRVGQMPQDEDGKRNFTQVI